jgi:hypothetical protein
VLPTPSAPPTTRTAPCFKSVEVCPVRGVGSEPVNCEACEAGAYNWHEADTANSGASGPEKISTPPEIKSVAFGNSVTVGLVRIAPMLPAPANVSEAGSKASMPRYPESAETGAHLDCRRPIAGSCKSPRLGDAVQLLRERSKPGPHVRPLVSLLPLFSARLPESTSLVGAVTPGTENRLPAMRRRQQKVGNIMANNFGTDI